MNNEKSGLKKFETAGADLQSVPLNKEKYCKKHNIL